MAKYDVTIADLVKILDEVESGNFDADLGGHVLKSGFDFKVKVNEEAAEPLSASKRIIGQYLSMDMPKIKKRM